MAKVTVRKETGKLVIDFTYRGVRCREQTALPDSQQNRRRVQGLIEKIKKAQQDGIFVYRDFFPESALAARFDPVAPTIPVSIEVESTAENSTPLFQAFANQWVDEHSIEWRRSHIRSLLSTLNSRLIPHFGGKAVGQINKSDILAFRATLAKVKGRGEKEGLSPKRINEIIGTLNQILCEAADRFEFTSPTTNIKRLRLRRTDVDPFSLTDVQRIMATVRVDYKQYFITRFFTGMRTGEVHGLKWKYVDFDLRVIRVRETFVLGEDEYTKTDGSQRDIQMSQPVFDALQEQFKATGGISEYVFCNLLGAPLDNKNFSDRIWYPLLRHLGLQKRRPYQMRHTAATLWLASGEAPEWIARQLGHTSTEMLFRVYSRYVPNLTRQDGSAMERLLASRLSAGPLIPIEASAGSNKMGQGGSAGSRTVYVPAGDVPPQPVPKPRGIHGARRVPTPTVPMPRSTDSESIVMPQANGDYRGSEPQPPPYWQRTAVKATSSLTRLT
ncbi:tyrosine-type recombinase/integrase [Polaromonas sp.]|uniref:tyrosine-type recombinase/integrase n=1 Tax=Polaromonas sp. TaxID=1869339 RepID=UPI0032653FCA